MLTAEKHQFGRIPRLSEFETRHFVRGLDSNRSDKKIFPLIYNFYLRKRSIYSGDKINSTD